MKSMKTYMIKHRIRRACSKLAIITLLLASAKLYGADLQELAARGMSDHLAGLHFLNEKKEPSDFGIAFETGWSSKYISEGVDVFGEGGVWEISPEIVYKNFSFNTWYGLSDTINASETKFILSYDCNIGGRLCLTPSYEWAIASPGRAVGYTPALGLSYAINDWLNIGGDIQSDAGDHCWRSYYDLYVEGSWKLSRRLTLDASVLYGFNDGYLGSSVGHGSNTLDYSIRLNLQCTERICFVFSVNYSQALTVLRQASSNDDETDVATQWGDEFWVGSYLTYEF